MKPLIYLHYRLLVNNIRYTLRTPKRLIPAVIIALAFLQSFSFGLISCFMPPLWRMGTIQVSGARMDQIWSGVFLALTAAVVTLVYNALRDGLLIFMPPHIDFLFPAPVLRRDVLVMKLLGDYGRFIFYSGMFAAVAVQFYAIVGKPVSSAFVGWLGVVLLLAFATNATHALNIITSYGAARLKLAARAFKLAMVIIVVALIASGMTHFILTGDAAASISAAAKNALARFIFAPVAWCADLVVGQTPGIVRKAGWEMLWLLLLSVGSLAVLLRRPENFYEPSLAVSARVARIRSAAYSGGWSSVRTEKRRDSGRSSSAGLWIPEFGRGATALVWKYIVVQYRRMGWSLLGLFLLPPIAAFAANSLVTDKGYLALSPYAMLYVVWGYIMAAQQDMRSELKQADVIKAMPIRGMKIVLAQSFAQWLQLMVFVAIAGVSILLLIPEADKGALVLVIVGSASVALSSIAACAVAVLLYPDARDRFQMVVPTVVGMLFIGLTVVPSLAVIVVLMALHEPLVTLAVTLIILNCLIAWAALHIAGELFDRLDPTGG